MSTTPPDPPFRYMPPPRSVTGLKTSIIYKLMFAVGKSPVIANERDWLYATLLATRDCLVGRWLRSTRAQFSQDARQVYYLSMEFLMGRTLSNALMSLGIYDELAEALQELGIELGVLVEKEIDPGLGNGGLGRLAACFLDSLATLALPSRGYGIRFEYGIFQQCIVNGEQAESPDTWLEYGNPWEFPRYDTRYKVRLGGRVQVEGDVTRWIETDEILACAYDWIIPGFDTDATTTLRLWSARASNAINLGKFNQGDYFAAVEDKNQSENVSRVLYPNDSTDSGRELRFAQEYFLASATLQDILSRHWMSYGTYDNLADKVAIHLNDTHPVLAIPEMMRLLMDEHRFSWLDAWSVTRRLFSYTNHTLMSEALETWPVAMMGRLLPRHLQIIFEINDYFLKEVSKQAPGDLDLLRRVSIIDETGERRIRMAWLAVIASHKVNGVSRLHSELMVRSLFSDFARIFPDKFCNVTNGVTPRRWLALANPSLSTLLDRRIGPQWRTNLDDLAQLEKGADDALLLEELQNAKRHNKERLALYIARNLGVAVRSEALFDVQIKRIHEYKRQLLNILHVITRYNRILAEPDTEWTPRVVIMAGKAASAYVAAKQIIHLANDVGGIINNDPRVGDRLKFVFIPNYSVSLAEKIIPAANLSEQISLAGTEASGTSNMKFALNGALTIGTLDGANIEILERVGPENIFIFGNTEEQVEALRAAGYDPRVYYDQDEELRRALVQIATGVFSPGEPGRYKSLYESLVNLGDHYQLLADYRSYVTAQEQADAVYRDQTAWTRKALVNIARMGYFSSDRTIRDYAEHIWKITPLKL